MTRLLSLALAALIVVAGCTDTYSSGQVGSDGRPLPKVYRIRGGSDQLQFRVLDSVNALRTAVGAGPVVLNAELNAAADTHSRDMSRQNRPWHFGSDGSSPIDRVRRAGYTGHLIGENISETYETETETLAAWMQEPGTRAVVMDRAATSMGFAWFQEPNGKIWWTMVMGN